MSGLACTAYALSQAHLQNTVLENPVVALCSLLQGQVGILDSIVLEGPVRFRLFDFGFITGTPIELVRWGPGGAILAVKVRGTLVALRRGDANALLVKSVTAA